MTKPKSIVYLALFVFVALAGASCKKSISTLRGIPDIITDKYPVISADIQSIVYPMGITGENIYTGTSSDYIDLSVKGEVYFSVNSQTHTLEYDTTVYKSLTPDSTIICTQTGIYGIHNIVVSNVTDNSFKLTENSFGVDAGTRTIYTLRK